MTDAALYTVTDLGGLPGFSKSQATALNDVGQVVGTLTSDAVNAAGSALDSYGFLWSENQMMFLGRCLPRSINNHGQIAGAVHDRFLTVSSVAAALGHAGRLKTLTPRVDDKKSLYSMAEAINESGLIVGFSKSSQAGKIPCLWEDGTLCPLPLPKGCQGGSAAAVNDRGQIAGEVWVGIEANNHAILWEADRAMLLGEPPGCGQSRAVALNNRGTVLLRGIQSNLAGIVRQVMKNNTLNADTFETLNYDETSFLWQKGQMTVIDVEANALNDSHQVVGWISPVLGQKSKAFLWQEGKLNDLNTLIPVGSDWHLLRANGINNNGQIVGYGYHHGQCRAFLLTPITK